MSSVGFSLPDSATLRKYVLNGLDFAAALVSLTKTTLDDVLVNAVQKIAGSDEGWELFYDILYGLFGGQVPEDGLARDDMKKVCALRLANAVPGLDIATIMMLIQAVMGIITWWKNRKNPAPTPTPTPLV